MHAQSKPLFMVRVQPLADTNLCTPLPVIAITTRGRVHNASAQATGLRHDAWRQRPTHFHEGAFTNGGRRPGGGSPTHNFPCLDSHCHDPDRAWGETPAWRRCALHAATARGHPLPHRPIFPAAAAAGRAGAPPAAPAAAAPRGHCGRVIGPLAGAAGPPRRPRWRRRRPPRGVGGNTAAAACRAGGTSDSGQRRDCRRGR